MLAMHTPGNGHQFLLCLITLAGYSLLQEAVSTAAAGSLASSDTARRRRRDRDDDAAPVGDYPSDVIVEPSSANVSSTKSPSHSTSFHFLNPKPRK